MIHDPLKQKFINEGFSNGYVVRSLLQKVGVTGYTPENIGFTVTSLDRGMGVNSAIYRVEVYAKNTKRELPALATFIVKDPLYPENLEGKTLYEGTEGEEHRRDHARYERRFLMAFNPGLVVDYNDRYHRLVLRAMDDSFDRLIQNELDQQGSAIFSSSPYDSDHRWKSYLGTIIDSLENIWVDSAERAHAFEPGDLKPHIFDRQRYIRKMMGHLEHLVGWFCTYRSSDDASHAQKYYKAHIPALRIEVQAISSFLDQRQAIIHADARTENVLYRKKPNGTLEFGFCDFGSVHLGPVALDLVTLLHDFYVTRLGITEQQKKELFDASMQKDSVLKLWKPSTMKIRTLKNYLSLAFVDASTYCLLKDVGVRSRLQTVLSENQYADFVQKHPHEENPSAISDRLRLLHTSICGTKRFPTLQHLVEHLVPDTRSHSSFRTIVDFLTRKKPCH